MRTLSTKRTKREPSLLAAACWIVSGFLVVSGVMVGTVAAFVL